MSAWIYTIMDYLAQAGLTVLTFLLGITTTGVMALSEPPAPPVIPDTPDAMTQEITVMSFNVWAPGKDSFGQRLPGAVQTILKERPDSFGLQEASESWRFALRRELRGDYAVACWKARYWGLQEGTPIFYLKDKYQLLEEGVFWLSDVPDKTSTGWDASMPRIAGYAVLKDKQTGFTYVHFNSHFDHIGPIARANSSRMIADRINEMGLPAVFTADVNASPDSLPTQYLEAGGLLDLRKVAGEADQGGTFHAYAGRSSVIDYIYANHHMRLPETAKFWVIRDEYNGMFPSDHFAICATLTLAN